jgi:hypothetical protein
MASAHSSRMQYDYPAYQEAVKRSTDPFLYRLYPGYGYNCNTCFPPFGPYNTHGVNVTYKNVIDVDSILSGRTVLNSKANEFSQPTPLDYNTVKSPECNRFIETEYSRYTHPIQNYRGIWPDRFYPLNQDPQCHIFWNFEVNTKLEAKDNFRATFQIPVENSEGVHPVDRLGLKVN